MSNELTDTNVLRGLDAIQALNSYAQKLENQKINDPANPHIDFLIRTARALSETISKSEDCKQQPQPKKSATSRKKAKRAA